MPIVTTVRISLGEWLNRRTRPTSTTPPRSRLATSTSGSTAR